MSNFHVHMLHSYRPRIKAWADRNNWWSVPHQQSLNGLVWFCQLETNPLTHAVFNYHLVWFIFVCVFFYRPIKISAIESLRVLFYAA